MGIAATVCAENLTEPSHPRQRIYHDSSGSAAKLFKISITK